MADTFGSVLSWTLIAFASAFMLYHWFRVVKSRRLETRNGAGILLGLGFLILEVPAKMYTELPADALAALSWLAALTIASAIALEFWDRRTKRRDGSTEPARAESTATDPENQIESPKAFQAESARP